MWPWDGFRGLVGFRGLEGFKGLEGLEGFRGWQTASLDAHKKPLMWPWDACWLPALDAHKKGF